MSDETQQTQETRSARPLVAWGAQVTYRLLDASGSVCGAGVWYCLVEAPENDITTACQNAVVRFGVEAHVDQPNTQVTHVKVMGLDDAHASLSAEGLAQYFFEGCEQCGAQGVRLTRCDECVTDLCDNCFDAHECEDDEDDEEDDDEDEDDDDDAGEDENAGLDLEPRTYNEALEKLARWQEYVRGVPTLSLPGVARQ